ncbi:hypothetical protein DFH28DRAFT_903653 [Melampsora americana]|nr:hypothetical protein DFH28DRAFT_903653 [Melampsora americana]
MVQFRRKLRITQLFLRMGPRGGIYNATRHNFVEKGSNASPILVVRGNNSSYVVCGLTGFLALLHYAGRCPTRTMKIRRLVLHDINRSQSGHILDYLSIGRNQDHGLSGIVEIKIKFVGAKKCQIYKLKEKKRVRRCPWDLNSIHSQGNDNTEAIRINSDRFVLADLGDFLSLVDLSSRHPRTTRSLKRLVVKCMEEADWLEILNFFTKLEAGYESFPSLVQLIHGFR